MASRSLGDLSPLIIAQAELFLARCKQRGIDLIVTCTYRSNREQEQLYAKGRTAPGPIVTYALPGESKHNHVNAAQQPAALALDVVPIRDGKCIWNSKDPIWQEVGEIGEASGLAWAGRWTKFREYAHFEVKDQSA
jgi:peptidoglycan L-alanyl-D-glutamate endopeptidase CwlK